jgi:succinylglutamate desuccinylase
MFIGVDKNNYIISIGKPNDDEAYEIKMIENQTIDIVTRILKYENGRVIDLGIKPELTMTEEEKILKELKELDTIISRPTEDLYTLTNTTPYKSTQEVIERKEELRLELQNLTKEGE